MPIHHSLHKLLTALFVLMILFLSALGYSVFRDGIKIDVDLKSLLPVDASSEVITHQVEKRMMTILGDQLVIAIDTQDIQLGLTAAKALDSHIKENPHFSVYDTSASLDLIHQQQIFLQNYHYHLLTKEQKQQLQQNPEALLELAQINIFGLGSSKSILTLEQDPLGLFNQFWQQQIPNVNASLHEGRLVFSSNERHTIIQLLKLKAHSGDIVVQEAIAAWTKAVQTQMAQDFPSVTLLLSGPIFHSAFASANAKKEVSIIGTGSIIGIIILFLFAFRRIDVLLLSVLSVGLGCCGALIVVCYFFQEIHLIALVFGASLIGVAIDYSLHFVSKLQALPNHTAYHRVFKQLILPLTLGLITSTLSYACLFQSNLTVLNEIAVFSMAGLVIAWLYVCVVYPIYFRKTLPTQSSAIRFIAQLPFRFWQKKTYAISASLLVTIIILSGFCMISLSDQVKTFYKPPADLLASEHYLQKKLNNISLHQYLLLRAPNTESLLQLEEQVRQSLDSLIEKGELGDYLALSQQVPSVKTQTENRHLLQQQVYQNGGLLDQLAASIELDGDFSIQAKTSFEKNASFLQLNDWITHARPDQQILWLGNIDNEVASIIAFKSIANTASLQTLSNDHSILFVDKVQSISNSIHQLTSQAIQWLLVSYLLIFCLFVAYFRRLAVLVLPMTPLLATLLALALLSWFSIPINLFHIFGCYLILGFGIDYAIFYFFDQKKDSAAQYGNFLAAMTSVMSFGFLAFSSTPMVQSFGLILLLGCLFSLLIAPLAGYFGTQEKT